MIVTVEKHEGLFCSSNCVTFFEDGMRDGIIVDEDGSHRAGSIEKGRCAYCDRNVSNMTHVTLVRPGEKAPV